MLAWHQVARAPVDHRSADAADRCPHDVPFVDDVAVDAVAGQALLVYER